MPFHMVIQDCCHTCGITVHMYMYSPFGVLLVLYLATLCWRDRGLGHPAWTYKHIVPSIIIYTAHPQSPRCPTRCFTDLITWLYIIRANFPCQQLKAQSARVIFFRYTSTLSSLHYFQNDWFLHLQGSAHEQCFLMNDCKGKCILYWSMHAVRKIGTFVFVSSLFLTCSLTIQRFQCESIVEVLNRFLKIQQNEERFLRRH